MEQKKSTPKTPRKKSTVKKTAVTLKNGNQSGVKTSAAKRRPAKTSVAKKKATSTTTNTTKKRAASANHTSTASAKKKQNSAKKVSTTTRKREQQVIGTSRGKSRTFENPPPLKREVISTKIPTKVKRTATKYYQKMLFFGFIIVVTLAGGVMLFTSNSVKPELIRNIKADEVLDKKGNELFYQRYSKLFGVDFTGHENKKMLKLLYSWRGIPYVYGGTSTDGIDCSGFVYLAYWNVYKVHLNRTSRGLVNDVFVINQSDLEFGDLLFFRQDGQEISHVGIYLGNRKFIHSSINRGVVINSLDQPFYNRIFYIAGRVKKGKKIKFNDLFAF